MSTSLSMTAALLSRTTSPLRIVCRPLRRRRKSCSYGRKHVSTTASMERADFVGFGNVCVDVRIRVPKFPIQHPGWDAACMRRFQTQFPRDSIQEPGGISNTLFAATRLGLHATCIGHLGRDQHGHFCRSCFVDERIQFVEGFNGNGIHQNRRLHPFVNNTALCLVFVDPNQRHLFCSTFQVTPGPVFCDPAGLTPVAVKQIRDARGIIFSGYALQECGKELLEFVMDEALCNRTVTFFDPGPYGSSLARGTRQEKATLDAVLSRSQIILATQEEAEMVTGMTNPADAGRALVEWPHGVAQWVVIKLGAQGSLFFQRGSHCLVYTPGFSVPVSDTVGCGDSFAAAVAYGYIHGEGRSVEGVMELANAIGAVTATQCGAGRNVANLHQITALLKKHLTVTPGSWSERSGVSAALELLYPDLPSELCHNSSSVIQ